jgi:hypothetical protein
MTVGESIVKQTGWNVSILVGGPMPRLGGELTTYMFVIFLLQREMTHIDLGLLISTHFGQTLAGSDFKEFLGDDEYENHIIAPFDNFLHESFGTRGNPVEYARVTNLLTGPDACKSRARGMLGLKDNSSAANEDDEDDEDPDIEEDVSRVPKKNIENNKQLQHRARAINDYFKKFKSKSSDEDLVPTTVAKNVPTILSQLHG